MMPRASAGSGWSPALAAAQIVLGARHRLRVHLLGGGQADFLVVLFLDRHLADLDAADAARGEPIADGGARRAIGELVHQRADVAQLRGRGRT